jgi:NADH:ubiquinone oxidoreductase subunit
MDFLDKLKIKLCYKMVGSDEFGNQYYQDPKSLNRYVLYKGIVEASKIPSSWHGWMHYVTDKIPTQNQSKNFWQKIHLPNLTGTNLRYFIDGHLAGKSSRIKTGGDYQPWKPLN